MEGALFRQEVIQARAGSSLGRIVVVPAWPLWAGVGVVLLAALALVLLLALGSYTRKTRVTGELVPGLGVTRMEAPIAGTLARLHVSEGQRVLAGDMIAVVQAVREGRGGDAGDVERQSLSRRVRAHSQDMAASRQQLLQRKSGLQIQVNELVAEGALAMEQQAAQRRRLELARRIMGRMRQLAQQDYVSRLQLSQYEAEVLDQEAGLLAVQRESLALARSLHQARQALAEWPSQWKAFEAQANRGAALLRAEAADVEARSHAILRATVAGIVSRIEVQAGQPVHPGQVILGLLPALSGLEAHLHAPSSAMGQVAPGNRVQLRYHAYPYQDHGHFGGWVKRVDGRQLPASSDGAFGGFRIVVVPDRQDVMIQGRSRRLKAGLTLDAHVLGEQRRLWQWAIQPVRMLADPLSNKADSPPGSPTTAGREKIRRNIEPSAGVQKRPSVL